MSSAGFVLTFKPSFVFPVGRGELACCGSGLAIVCETACKFGLFPSVRIDSEYVVSAADMRRTSSRLGLRCFGLTQSNQPTYVLTLCWGVWIGDGRSSGWSRLERTQQCSHCGAVAGLDIHRAWGYCSRASRRPRLMLIELLVILFQFFRLSRTLKLRPKTVVAYRRETAVV